MSIEKLVKKLRLCENDPMWADHAEVPKKLCKLAADEIEKLLAERNELASLLGMRD